MKNKKRFIIIYLLLLKPYKSYQNLSGENSKLQLCFTPINLKKKRFSLFLRKKSVLSRDAAKGDWLEERGGGEMSHLKLPTKVKLGNITGWGILPLTNDNH